MKADTDILVITHNRPLYSRLTLERLLATCDETMRVWLWHNGNDAETLAVARSFVNHPRLHQFHHSPENRILIDPINWLWTEAPGDYLCVVGDDSLMPDRWAHQLRAAHRDVPELGVIACWHFRPEDFQYELAAHKIREFPGGHKILENCWVQGSGVMMKKACVEKSGLLRPDMEHPRYCFELSESGWINGWHYPLIYMDHMDDPRSAYFQNEQFCPDGDRAPLTARRKGFSSLEEYASWISQDARKILTEHLPEQAERWRIENDRSISGHLRKLLWRLRNKRERRVHGRFRG